MTMPKSAGELRGRDPGGMYEHMIAFQRQLMEADAIGRDVALKTTMDGVTSIVALGMGGSAIGAEFASAYLEDRLPDSPGREIVLQARCLLCSDP